MSGIETQVAEWVVQSGTAGLIAWMWLAERRHAGERERQLGEAHERILSDGERLDVLLRTVEQNTRASTALESAQRRLVDVIETVWGVGRVGRGRGSPIPTGDAGQSGSSSDDGNAAVSSG